MCNKKCIILIYLVQAASCCFENGTVFHLTTSQDQTQIINREIIEYCEGRTWTLKCKFNLNDCRDNLKYYYVTYRCNDDACDKYVPLTWGLSSTDELHLTLTLNIFSDGKIFGCAIINERTRILGSKVYKFKLDKSLSTEKTTETTSRTAAITSTTETRREEASFRVDYTYHVELNAFLKFHDVAVTWFDAKRLCHYEGAMLASPNNTKMAAVLMSMIKSSETHEVFTGLNSLNSEGYYYTIEGSPLSSIPHKWAEGEPNNVDGKEHCLVLNANGSLLDVRCDASRSFVCYRQYKGEIINECDTLDNGYKLYNETNKCYKFHSQPKTWSKAHQHCAAENAHLVVINSATESNLISRIYEQQLPESIKISEWESVAFVGFRYDNSTDRYETIEGLSLAESGFEQFHPGNPDSPVPGGMCGGVYRSGMLDDTDCQQDHIFICEKNPRCTACG